MYQQPPNAPLSPTHTANQKGNFFASNQGSTRPGGVDESDIFASDHHLNTEIIAQSGPDVSFTGGAESNEESEEPGGNVISSTMGHRNDAPMSALDTTSGGDTVASFSPKQLHVTVNTTYSHADTSTTMIAQRGGDGDGNANGKTGSISSNMHIRQQEERIADLKQTIENFKRSHAQGTALSLSLSTICLVLL